MNLSLTSSPTASNFFDHVSELESFGNYPFVLETLSPNEKFDVHFSRIKEQVFEDFESSPQRQGSVSFQAEPAFEIEKTLDFDSVEAPRPSCHPSFPILTEKFSLKRTKDFKSDSDEPVLQASPCYEAKIGFYRSLHKEKEEFRTSAMSLVSFIQEKMTKGELLPLFECEICQRKFKSGVAKGGHMSKRHPKESTKFKHRVEVSKNRSPERKRSKFLHSLA